MLRLTDAPFDLFTLPPRVGIGDDLNVEIPDGAGMLRDRWDVAADKLFETLISLADDGQYLQYAWLDDHTTARVRIINDAYPATHTLTHPKLIRFLRTSLTALFGCEPVIYVQGDLICARPQYLAGTIKEWKGPYEISTGYCLQPPQCNNDKNEASPRL
ncbi:hypothetical protein F7230_08830 [Corynebacterium sp. 320]|uniref:Uncharacterized protein n=1 Tax=Corynebacterium zhongnanshanii TaxID=2768834 RepID=A0ABQ6VIM8_9CORY|nr:MULTISPECIES: hypothetical protein [Corynebacterium]KAB1502524.1 hypothetical protein F7230_08830 [Corynebacterium sp. 320]KAB1551255.1 hypothetical protein F7233_06950 [Corynebacterium sp. 321]KAB1551917.1 hypothetical protein F7232_07320 [Corynebacterium sp. 319]KAB3520794.1 hypothetical protein F8377_05985 [Corynebacterium zhongnanshanii]KAB3526131.1 hypothetical protein F8354_08830 [Corynebacterium sp. 250]